MGLRFRDVTIPDLVRGGGIGSLTDAAVGRSMQAKAKVEGEVDRVVGVDQAAVTGNDVAHDRLKTNDIGHFLCCCQPRQNK